MKIKLILEILIQIKKAERKMKYLCGSDLEPYCQLFGLLLLVLAFLVEVCMQKVAGVLVSPVVIISQFDYL